MTELVDGKIVPIDIETEMRKSYMLYSMSVIVGVRFLMYETGSSRSIAGYSMPCMAWA